MAQPETLRFSRKLYRYAKGPILEDDFPRSGEDVTAGDKKGNLAPQVTGGVCAGTPSVKPCGFATSPKGEALAVVGNFLITSELQRWG